MNAATFSELAKFFDLADGLARVENNVYFQLIALT
jgi:hypothetical protein